MQFFAVSAFQRINRHFIILTFSAKMQMVTFCLWLHLANVEFYLQKIKNGFSNFFL